MRSSSGVALDGLTRCICWSVLDPAALFDDGLLCCATTAHVRANREAAIAPPNFCNGIIPNLLSPTRSACSEARIEWMMVLLSWLSSRALCLSKSCSEPKKCCRSHPIFGHPVGQIPVDGGTESSVARRSKISAGEALQNKSKSSAFADPEAISSAQTPQSGVQPRHAGAGALLIHCCGRGPAMASPAASVSESGSGAFPVLMLVHGDETRTLPVNHTPFTIG